MFKYAFARVSSRYRARWGMRFYEFEVLSTHYHIVLFDRFGRLSSFIKELNAVIARGLNAARGTSGAFFDGEPGIQTVLGDERLVQHCVYTLANAVSAGLVHKTAHWKGCNSLRMEYGREYVIDKPLIGIWSKKQAHKGRKASQRSGRAAYANRSKMPKTAVLMLDRPPVMLELSDGELRAKIRADLAQREAEVKEKRKGNTVLGMKAARQIPWSTTPEKGKELFGRQPTFSTQTLEQRIQMKRLRIKFLAEYRAALARWRAGDSSAVFPAGTVQMRLRHNALTEPVPLDLLLAG